MSCSLKQRIIIKDINKLKSYLFPEEDNEATKDEDNETDSWSVQNWSDNWGDEEHEEEETNQQKSTESEQRWLHDCIISLSPAFDCLILARNSDAALLTGTRETTSGRSSALSFSLSEKLYLAEENDETITSMISVPIVSTKKTSYGNVDWCCLIVGFSSGYLRMYTENATKLMSQLFHESSVVEIKCRTLDGGSGGGRKLMNSEDVEEVTILYENALVVLDGFSLFQTLRACRSQVALAAASGGQAIEPPPMSYKKWALTGGQNKITSHASIGTLHPGPFDQMRTASILGGYNTDVRTAPRSMSCYTITGSSPFVGFYYALEGTSQPLLSHVALAVASKLKSAIVNAASGWLSWGRGTQPDPSQTQKPKVELGTPLDIRCGIPDSLRHGRNITMAPGADVNTVALAAMTDSFGRVILLDLTQNVAVRVWKGYRDAQVGFVRVFDDAHHRKGQKPDTWHGDKQHIRRHALFLVIYAPRRGLLEVWACIHGPRVGAFNVSKNARLLYAGHGLLGTNGMTNQSLRARTFQCCLLEGEGKVMEVIIPYHLALSDGNSKRARDMHLLKKLNLLLHGRHSYSGEEAYNILMQMRICDSQRQGLEKLLNTRHLGTELLLKCINALQSNLKQAGAAKKEEQRLVKYCKCQITLIKLYQSIEKLNQNASLFSKHDENYNVEEFTRLLHLTQPETQDVINVLKAFSSSQVQPTISFNEKTKQPKLDVAEFLSNFEIDEDSAQDGSTCNITLNLSNENRTAHLANFFFNSSLFGSTSPQDILFAISDCFTLKPLTILTLVFNHWLTNTDDVFKDLLGSCNKLLEFVEEMSKRIQRNTLEVDTMQDTLENNDQLLELWDWIREKICQPTNNVTASYLLALICRSVSIEIKSEKSKHQEAVITDEAMQVDDNNPPTYDESCQGENVRPSSGSGDWETLWVDTEKWNLLTKQLEDCIFVNITLSLGNLCIGRDRKSPDQDKPTPLVVSLEDIIMKGTGLIAESICKCICRLSTKPALLNKEEFDKVTEEWKNENAQEFTFLSFLHDNLLPRFPFSLASDVLHGHCFWESLLLWNKDLESVSLLSLAIEHLQRVKYDIHARHGLAVMAWKMTVLKKVLQLAQLVEKVGKAPKDRLCRKEVGISDTSMPMFCESCTDLLQVVEDIDLDMVPKPDETLHSNSAMEDPWQNTQGQRSIVDMGRAHPRAHYGIVQHLMHLCFILHATMKFSLRSVKPLSKLFDAKGRKCFSVDISIKEPQLPNIDSMELSINRFRQQFLEKTVTAAVERLYEKTTEDAGSKSNYEKEQMWIETTIHMAYEFQIDVDKLRIQYATLLYSYGLDEIGKDVCIQVSDKSSLSAELILIVGQRLNYVLHHARPDDGVVMMSQMPTTITTWIKAQDSTNLKVKEINVEDTLVLSRAVISNMPETHPLYSTSLYLEQAVEAIKSA